MKKLLLSVGIAAAILAGCNSSSSGGGIAPVPGPTVAPTAVPTAAATATPVATAVPTASPTPTAAGATATPSPSPSPTAAATTPAALTLSYSNAPAPAAPFLATSAAQTGTVNFNAPGEQVLLVPSGGKSPYTAVTANCTGNASVTVSQVTGLTGFLLTSTTTAGSCNIVVTDSSNPQNNATINEVTTLVNGTVQ